MYVSLIYYNTTSCIHIFRRWTLLFRSHSRRISLFLSLSLTVSRSTIYVKIISEHIHSRCCIYTCENFPAAIRVHAAYATLHRIAKERCTFLESHEYINFLPHYFAFSITRFREFRQSFSRTPFSRQGKLIGHMCSFTSINSHVRRKPGAFLLVAQLSSNFHSLHRTQKLYNALPTKKVILRERGSERVKLSLRVMGNCIDT